MIVARDSLILVILREVAESIFSLIRGYSQLRV